MEVFYHLDLKSLVYFGASSSPEHWDADWRNVPKLRHNAFVLKYTRRPLINGARALEVGCGNGEKVQTLQSSGSQAKGIDRSLGVIEHSQEGFEAPLAETSRVVKPGGTALVTVPSMSWLRRFKAHFNAYPALNTIERPAFFQYVYDPRVVIDGFQCHGFELLSSEALEGVKGFKDEVFTLLSPIAGHIRFYVFRRLA